MTAFQRITIALLIGLAASLAYRSVSAASLSVYAPVTVVPMDGVANVEVRMSSDNATVNAVDVTLRYDETKLQLLSVTPDASFVTIWAEQPRITAPGTIQFSGGRPDGSVTLDAPLAMIAFKPLKAGATTVDVQESASGVYLHDGYGTPAALATKPITLIITEPLNLLAQPTSSTHPDESLWYSNREFTVTWTTFESSEVTYALSRDPSAEPELNPSENDGSVSFPSLSDGVWYFTFRERQRGQERWSPILRRVVRIDGTPPAPFDVAMRRGEEGETILSFIAEDDTSGIASYRVRVTRSVWWRPWVTRTTVEQTQETYVLPGTQDVTSVDVTAADNAGNLRPSRWNGPNHRRDQLILCGSLILSAALLAVGLFAIVRFTKAIGRGFRRKR